MLSKFMTIMQRGGGHALKQPHVGAILIEFALAIPILIAIIYYLHDIPKLARMHKRMKLVAHEIVNTLQNISQNRGENNRKITRADIGYAVRSAYLAFYPGKTMYATEKSAHPLGHFPLGFVYYVVGEDDGTASVVWAIHFHMDGSYSNLQSVAFATQSTTHSYSTVKILKNKVPSEIYPQLSIKPGEKKIMVECTSLYHTNVWLFSDGRKCMDVSPKEAYGFYFCSLRPTSVDAYFNSVVIFTPKRGLFDEKQL